MVSVRPQISRRSFLKGTGTSLAVAPLLTGLAAPTDKPGTTSANPLVSAKAGSGFAADARAADPARRRASACRTRLVLLGTTGGVSWFAGSDRASSSSALVVDGEIYLVDLGQGSTNRLAQAFNEDTGGASSTFLSKVRALFLTHLHQDHTADYPNLLLIGPGAGLGSRKDALTGKPVPLKVYGPCNRGQVEIDKTNFVGRGGQVIYTDSADPAKITATPGTRQMTETIWQAYAQCINDMALDNGYPDFRTLVEIEEIGEPLSAQTDDRNVTCPAMAPFEVYSDDLVRVSATLVSHHQVYPSFAFRFDTSDGSVVLSGDTGKNTNGNLARLADGADILVHEVIDPAWIDRKFGANPQPPMDALKTHMLESHTTIDEVGEVAEACRVKTLVLNHIVPANTPIEHLRRAKTGYSGKLIVGDDLMEIGVGQPVRANNASME